MKEDDFMLKKVISTALAFITVASSVVSISSNAYVITEKDSDRYNQIVSQYSDLPDAGVARCSRSPQGMPCELACSRYPSRRAPNYPP